jgi:apolipoprotein N-acyltransferase
VYLLSTKNLTIGQVRQKLISLLLILGAVALTGTMLVLALPLGEQAWLAWFMLFPLLWTTKEKGFIVGFLAGLASVFLCAWLSTTGVFYRHKDFESSPAWNYTACGLYAFSFAIFFAIWADKKNFLRPVWWLAALAVGLEAILLIEIPATLAVTQYRNGLAVGLASIGGIWLTSFVVWYANVSLAKIEKGTFRWEYLPLAALFLGSFIDSGGSASARVQGVIKVGITQIRDGSDEEQAAAHRLASKDAPVFIVWPEFSGMLFVSGDDTSKLQNTSLDSSPLITSFRDTKIPLPHNVAALFAKGRESVRYEKRKLFAKEKDMHSPGDRAIAVPIPSVPGAVGLNICFDSCYPSIIRETASLPDVRVVALPTIDPDSSHYFVAAVHAAYTPFRSAENGVAFVRADGHFASMIVNEKGQIVAELKDEQKAITANISGNRTWTLYRVFGDWFLYLSVILVVFPTFLSGYQKFKSKSQGNSVTH